eukprot:COSAG06_NODE_3519_length_5232_cov_9.358660_3_plen_84_part_00
MPRNLHAEKDLGKFNPVLLLLAGARTAGATLVAHQPILQRWFSAAAHLLRLRGSQAAHVRQRFLEVALHDAGLALTGRLTEAG